MLPIVVSCAKSFEQLLFLECQKLGLQNAKLNVAYVEGAADLKTIYRICLHSRVASRCFLKIKQFKLENIDQYYDEVFSIQWDQFIKFNSSFKVQFVGVNEIINNSYFGALKTKDAIVDFCRQNNFNLEVDKDSPDLKIFVLLKKNIVYVSLDLSGDSLHKREYRVQQGLAPLKESLAAACLMRANWLIDTSPTLIDPVCGAGTILIEAAQMALNIPPHLNRIKWGFCYFKEYDADIWKSVYIEAENNILNFKEDLKIQGFDSNPFVIQKAKENIKNAGLEDFIEVFEQDIDLLKPINSKNGLLIANMPYGKRLGEKEFLPLLYSNLSEQVKKFYNWKIAILSSDIDLIDSMHLKSTKRYNLVNGSISCILAIFDIFSKNVDNIELNENSQMFFNRLNKNIEKILKFKDDSVEAFRVYDSDMPEYNFAIDIYKDFVYLQEYQAPKNIEFLKTNQRLMDAISAIKKLMYLPNNKLIVKQRRQQKGVEQYQKQDNKKYFFEISEYNSKYLINLHDYIDTGLFLDHRPMRKIIQKISKNKTVLNLFCYTGTISVSALKGGAKKVISVDLSKTYLEWAKNNAFLNGFRSIITKDVDFKNKNISLGSSCQFLELDCLTYLKEAVRLRQRFDLIFLDPPTFSNSKKIRNDFSVEKDHVFLIENAMKLLTSDGILYFSTNFKKFKMDHLLFDKFNIVDYSNQTIDFDFQRNPKIHYVFQITKK